MIALHEEHESGARVDRPELERALTACELTGAPDATEFVLGILIQVAAYERQRIRERTRAALQAPAESCAALLRQLQLSGWKLGQEAARGGRGRMASWGTGSPRRP